MAGGSQLTGKRETFRKRFTPTVGAAVSTRIGKQGKPTAKGSVRLKRSSATGYR